MDRVGFHPKSKTQRRRVGLAVDGILVKAQNPIFKDGLRFRCEERKSVAVNGKVSKETPATTRFDLSVVPFSSLLNPLA